MSSPAPLSSPLSSPRARCEFYFDTSSPWTYLAFARICQLAARTGCELILKPFLVGGVFNVSNKSLYAARDRLLSKADNNTNTTTVRKKPKEIWMDNDLKNWADFMSLDIKTMGERYNARTKKGQPGHPISSVRMLRGALVAQQEEGEDAMIRFANASFHAYWGLLQDVNSVESLREMHASAKLKMPFDIFLKRISDDDIKKKLRLNTQEVIDRGGFGSPSIYVSRPDGEPGFTEYFGWGNDRMELVEAAMLRARGKPWRYHSRL